MTATTLDSPPALSTRAVEQTKEHSPTKRRHTVLLSILDDFRPCGAESVSMCALQQFREIVETAARSCHGIILDKNPAGSVLTLFANPVDAVRAALYIRRRSQSQTLSDPSRSMPIRLVISGRSTPSDDIEGIRKAHDENLAAATHLGGTASAGDILIAERLVRYWSVREALAGHTIVRRRLPAGRSEEIEVYVLPGAGDD